MYIHEALQKTNRAEPYISRTSWNGTIKKGEKVLAEAVILPTNTLDKCIFYGMLDGKTWTPSLDELLAEDWEPAVRVYRVCGQSQRK